MLGAAGAIAVAFGSGPAGAACNNVTTTNSLDTITCSSTTTVDSTFPANSPNDRNYAGSASFTLFGNILPLATVDGFGFAISNSGTGGLTVNNAGAVVLNAGTPTQGGAAALQINGAGGTLTYAGNGSVTSTIAVSDGLFLHNTGAGDIVVGTAGTPIVPGFSSASSSNQLRTQTGTGTTSIFLDGGSLTASAGNGIGSGITSVSTGGDISMVLTGNTAFINNSGAVNSYYGINASSGGGNINITSNANMGAGGGSAVSTGVNVSASGGSITIDLTGGSINFATNASSTPGYGVNASTTGTGDITVTSGTLTGTGTGSTGVKTSAGTGTTTVTVSGNVTGAANGLDLTATSGNIAVTNNATLSGSSNAITGSTTGTFNITNNSLISGSVNVTASAASVFMNGGTWTSGSGTSTYSGSLNNSGIVTVTAGGNVTISGGVTNNLGGTITNNGTLNDDLNNAGLVNNNGIYNATVAANTGTINNNVGGTWTGNITSNANIITNAGGWTGTIVSNTGAITSSGTWDGAITSNANSISNSGTWTNGNIADNTGTIANTGSWTGTVANGALGIVNNNAGGTWTGDVISNAATGTVTNSGVIWTGNVLSNAGTIDNNTAWSGTVANSAGGIVNNNAGGTWTGNVVSNAATGTITNNGTLWSGDVVSNAGTIINNTFWTGNATTNGTLTNTGLWTGTVDNSGILGNSGTITGLVTNSGTATNSGSFGAGLTNTAGTTLNTATGTITGPVNVSGGTVTNNNLIIGTVGITATGQVDNNKTITGAVNNANIFNNNVNGTVSGLLTNSAGTTTNAGALNGGLSNTGGTTINSGIINNGANVSGGTLNTNTATSIVNGGLINSATVNAQGQVNGTIMNNGGLFTVTGALSSDATSTFTNANGATLAVNGGATYTFLGAPITNSGLVHVLSGGFLDAPTTGTSVINTSSGIITVDAGGRIRDDLSNAGLVTNNGIYDASVASNTGTIINNGVWTTQNATGFQTSGLLTTTGTLDVTSAPVVGLTNTGTVNAQGTILGTINNNSGGIFNVTGPLTGTGVFTNASNALLAVDGQSFTGLAAVNNNAGGFITISGGNLGAASITNDGTTIASAGVASTFTTPSFTNTGTGQLNLLGAGTQVLITGNMSNAGSINMQNGSPTNVVTVNGNYVGNGGTLGVDVNLNSGGSADLLHIVGTATGTTTVNFNTLAAGGFLATPLVIVQTGNAPLATQFNEGAGLVHTSGFVDYMYGRGTGTHANDWVITSQFNQNFGPLATISGAVGTIANGFYQPASSFVTIKPNPRPNEHLCGAWARGDAGRFDTGNTTALSQASQAINSLKTQQHVGYDGLQAGFDCGILNINGSGWHAHLGATGGQINGDVSQSDGSGSVNVDAPFVGGYFFLTNGSFTFDAAYRHDWQKLDFNVAAAGLVHEKVNGSGNTLAVSANYRWAVTNTFFVQPFGGLNWTVSDLDDFRFNAGTGGPVIGTISAGSDESLVGRMGVQLSYVQALTTTTFVVPFAAASAWRNFKNETDLKAVFDPGFGNATVDANTVGARDYMQYDVGVSLSNPSAGVVGFVKGTFREGDINGQAVSVGGRVNF